MEAKHTDQTIRKNIAMKFKTQYALQEFREIQPELFDEEGKRYTGVMLSNRQAEQMLTLIDLMADEIYTGTLLRQSLKEAREMLIVMGMPEDAVALIGWNQVIKDAQ